MRQHNGAGYRFLTVFLAVFTIGTTFWGSLPATQAPTIETPRTIDAVTTDAIAHQLGTEWHGDGPQVADFGPVDPSAPIDGMDQWLARKAAAAPRAASQRSAVTARRKLVVVRAAFSNQTTQRFTDAELMTELCHKWYLITPSQITQ